ncbi:MAG: AAA family ATPase [Anaerolineales bacterium]|nr:AAA family ATPase [Anaerolineales bacterium]
MMNNSAPGKIIIINGPSSSGKTTLALALQRQLDIPFLRFSFDVFLENNVLPMEKIRQDSAIWTAVRPSVFSGLHQCVSALAAAGNNLIFDHIIETQSWLDDLVQLLADFDVFFIGLHCSIEELERRETERGNRRAGEAREDAKSVHRFGSYDLELNSENMAEDNAKIVVAKWAKRSHPSAFKKMAAATAVHQPS